MHEKGCVWVYVFDGDDDEEGWKGVGLGWDERIGWSERVECGMRIWW